jgi:integrase
MGRRAISEFQVKQTSYPDAGGSWYIVGRPGGKRIRAWFDTKLVAQAEATRRNLSEKFGQCASHALSGSEIKAWLSKSDWSTKTRNNLLGYFHNAFNVAGELGLLTVNPLTETKCFNASKVYKKNNSKFLTVPQLTALLNNADASLVPYLSICAFAGLRSAEAKRLSWEQVETSPIYLVYPP